MLRVWTSRLMPKVKVPCSDIAGTIVSIGPTASAGFKLDDKVMAMFNPTKPSRIRNSGRIYVGTVGVQLAKAFGAYVVGVCSTTNVQLVKDLGADEVVDYKVTNVTEKYKDQGFDIVLDTVGPAKENDNKLAEAIWMLDEVAKADPVIDSVNEFTLPAVMAAFKKSQTGRAKGKIVIKIV
ncbi:hypothetical protein EC968_003757 [Mortierella alpina]|nr:hypothetical protein EC968_003757 [Mortierella alpina]